MSIAKTQKPPRIRRSPEAARETILAAAERLLLETGPQSLKLAEVAAEAGLANATVLHHFGSVDGVQTALMDRMIAQLAANIMAVNANEPKSGLRALFDAFETRGGARLAAWLELTGESHRLTASVRKAVQDVVAKRMAGSGLSRADAEDLVIVAVVLAMGTGLFGRSLATLLGKPANRARERAIELLAARLAALSPA